MRFSEAPTSRGSGMRFYQVEVIVCCCGVDRGFRLESILRWYVAYGWRRCFLVLSAFVRLVVIAVRRVEWPTDCIPVLPNTATLGSPRDCSVAGLDYSCALACLTVVSFGISPFRKMLSVSVDLVSKACFLVVFETRGARQADGCVISASGPRDTARAETRAVLRPCLESRPRRHGEKRDRTPSSVRTGRHDEGGAAVTP